MSISRKAINTLILAPILGMAVLTIQPATYAGDTAYAQSSPNSTFPGTNQRPSRRSTTPEYNPGGEGKPRASLPPCPIGVTVTHKCRPWTPPVVVAESKDDCECQMRRVNGVMMKDCYVLLKNLVHYCKAGHLIRR